MAQEPRPTPHVVSKEHVASRLAYLLTVRTRHGWKWTHTRNEVVWKPVDILDLSLKTRPKAGLGGGLFRCGGASKQESLEMRRDQEKIRKTVTQRTFQSQVPWPK